MMVWARTGDDQPQVGAFLVRTDAPGIAIERTWDHLGLRASRSDDVIFDAAPAHGHTGLEEPRPGFSGIPAFAAWNSLGLSALYLGVASAARDWLITFLNERTPASLGAPLATLPRFQAAVGEIDALLGTADDLIEALARRFDPATRPPSPARPPPSSSPTAPPSTASRKPWPSSATTASPARTRWSGITGTSCALASTHRKTTPSSPTSARPRCSAPLRQAPLPGQQLK